MKPFRDGRFGASGAKRIGSPTRTSMAPERNQPRPRCLQLAQSANGDGEHGGIGLLDQQADAGTEARQFAGL